MVIKNPTPLQTIAISSEGKTVLKACPGSGKTFVVAKKMVDETFKWKHKNKGIALLSFTNVANEEIARQIKQISGINRIGYPHFIGTIDSFISQWLFLPYGHLIMESNTRPKLLLETSSKILNYADKIWRKECYESRCNPLEFYLDIDGTVKNLYKDISSCSISKRKPCFIYKNFCLKNGYATYSDVTTIALNILERYPDIAKILAKRFVKLIIDEAQDTSEHQMKIIDKLIEAGVVDVMIIGDPDQAIYEWRDADPSVFIEKYNSSDWSKLLLNENFRCSQKICNATFIFSSLEKKPIAAGNSADSTFKPLILKYESSQKNRAVEEFLAICDNEGINITPDTVAVLVRGRTLLFGKDYSQINNLWQSEGSVLLSQATYERDFQSLRKATSLAEQALFHLFIDNNTPNDYISNDDIEKVVSLDIWRRLILDFLKNMPSANSELKIWKSEIESLIRKVGAKYSLNLQIDNPIKLKSRDKFLPDFLDQPLKYFYAKADYLSYLNATIHAVKGKTFDAVLLLLATNGKLTTNMINTKSIDSEEIRTAYVAMTRAKKVLVVAVPKTVKTKSLVRFPTELWDIRDV